MLQSPPETGADHTQRKWHNFYAPTAVNRIEQENKYDATFIDYQTREIFPIKENTIEFYIGDYAIHRLNAEDGLEYLIFYAPSNNHISN